jgi:hypothetical protein
MESQFFTHNWYQLHPSVFILLNQGIDCLYGRFIGSLGYSIRLGMLGYPKTQDHDPTVVWQERHISV